MVELMSTTVRPATVDDAETAVQVLRSSIVELCRADHHGDQPTIDAWLANKTVERFCLWLDNPDRYTVVAERDGTVCGVGMVGTDGVLYLCYVRPGHEGHGVGKALVHALEAEARRRGLSALSLDSTTTAEPFYESLGYVRQGESTRGYGITACNPYAKELDGIDE